MDKEIAALLATSEHVFTVEQARAVGISRTALTRAVRGLELDRIGRGVYAAVDPDRLADETYRLRVVGAMRRRRAQDAASGYAALVLHGLPTFDVTFHRVDVDSHTTTHRRHGRLWVHPWTPGVVRQEVAGVGVVPPAIACVQSAAIAGFEAGVIAMDAALHQGLVTRRALREAVALAADLDGVGIARAALEFADRRTESVGESRTRIVLSHNGFRFQPQVVICDAEGFVGRVDFLVDDLLVIEFDGAVKYEGDDYDEVMAAQEARELRLRQLGYRVLRITWEELEDPDAIVDRIRAERALLAA